MLHVIGSSPPQNSEVQHPRVLVTGSVFDVEVLRTCVVVQPLIQVRLQVATVVQVRLQVATVVVRDADSIIQVSEVGSAINCCGIACFVECRTVCRRLPLPSIASLPT